MNQNSIELKAFDLVETHQVTKIAVNVMSVELRVNARLNYTLFDANGKIVKCDMMLLEQPDYANWGANDDFIEEYVIGKLGLSKASVV